MLTDDELKAIAAAEAAAMPGPWSLYTNGTVVRDLGPVECEDIIYADYEWTPGGLRRHYPTCYFIAGCRGWVPQLLATVAELQARVADQDRTLDERQAVIFNLDQVLRALRDELARLRDARAAGG